MKKALLLLILAGAGCLYAQKPTPRWLNQKYAMFIHFGLYSQLGGVWDGKPVTGGYSEQIQSHAGIFSDWYAAVAREFDPVRWNADSIVALAKTAGMKSIVFTSKHHDGFCMYRSEYTDFNIVDATPYGRDVMSELAGACRRGGIGFGVYFSLIDWHFPQASPISSHNADPITPEHHAYNLKQVEEIMTRYGEISEIWFDMGSLTPGQSEELYELVTRLQPSCMISGRLGNDCSDFSVMADNAYPDYTIGTPWQTAASFFDETWGYRSWQERGSVPDKTNEKIKSLIRVVSRGGNYLLNIGPKGDGSVVEFEREVLSAVGRWLDRYGEAIYGTEANPFPHPFDWGDITRKGYRLYLLVDRTALPRPIRLDGLRGEGIEASFLGGGTLPVISDKTGVTLTVPAIPGEGPVEAIVLNFRNGFRIETDPGTLAGSRLSPLNASPVFAYSGLDYYTGFRSTIAYRWTGRPGRKSVTPVIDYTADEWGRKIAFSIDGQSQIVSLENGTERPAGPAPAPVRWKKTYLRRAPGIFGNEWKKPFPVPTGKADPDWKAYPDFRPGNKTELSLNPRSAVWILQELESDRAQELWVKIGSGNGVHVILNGTYLSMHIEPEGSVFREEIVRLPLKKGKNQLMLKLYNRFEKQVHFSIDPLTNPVVYRLELSPVTLRPGERPVYELRAADSKRPSRTMRLENIRIELK